MPATDFLIVLNLSVISIPIHVRCILYGLLRTRITYVLVLYILHGFSMWPELTPSFHGSMARYHPRLCSDLLRSALLRTTSFLSPSFLLRREWHRLLPTYAAAALLRSFVRVTLGESTLPFRRLQCATAPLFSALLSRPSGTASLPTICPLPTLSPSSCLPFSSATYFPGQQVFFHPPLFLLYV